MNFTNLVKQEKIKARKQNIVEVRKDIDKTWVKEKIQNHIIAFDGLFTFDEIKQAILTNDLVASKFCKDPSKQNISENLAGKVLGWDKCPQSGPKSIRFDENGDIVKIKSPGTTEAVDFNEMGYYITQKFTEEEGGAQNNQKEKVITFLKQGSIHHKVMAVVDGDYWDTHRQELIDKFKDNPNVKITSVTELTENN